MTLAQAETPGSFAEALATIEAEPYLWLGAVLPRQFNARMAPHHGDFWTWLWSIRRGVRPHPFIGEWPRGGGKSSSAEAALVALGARRRRGYAWYLTRAQELSDDHVENVAAILESPEVAAWYPDMATRAVSKYGASKGWRRNRLRTAAGFTVDAIGIDTAARGAKIEQQRPDVLVIDELDDDLDTPNKTDRICRLISKKILPAGASDLAVMGIQNLVHGDSVFARMAGLGSKPVDFLANRFLSGPIPAVEGLEVEGSVAEGYRVTGGRPTWEGQNLEVVQGQIDDWGYSAFMAEAQHEEQPPEGGMFGHLDFDAEGFRVDEADVGALQRIACWVDPAISDTDRSDSMGIQIDGLGIDGKVYRLYSWEQRAAPLAALGLAIAKTVEYEGTYVGVETDQGGDAWYSVFREARTATANRAREDGQHELAGRIEAVQFREQKAGAGFGPKSARAGRMLAWYERGVYRHVRGTHTTLERALLRFGVRKPYDVCDAAYWCCEDLLESGGSGSNFSLLMAGRVRR